LPGSTNPYILGYSINSRKPDSDPSNVPTFVPTGATFSTFDDAHDEGLNALNFLVMTNHHTFPTDPSAGLFSNNWLKSNDYDGRFIISERIFLDQWLIPILTQTLDIGPATPTDTGWSFDQKHENNHTVVNGARCVTKLTMVDAHIEESSQATAKISLANAGPNKTVISMNGSFRKDYKISSFCIAPEWMSETAVINWDGTLTLSAGTDGQVDLDLKMNVPDATKNTDGSLLGKMDIALIPDNQKILNDIGISFENSIKNRFNALQSFLGNLHKKFILPAGGVFFFKNLQMDDNGNVILEVTYKSLD